MIKRVPIHFFSITIFQEKIGINDEDVVYFYNIKTNDNKNYEGGETYATYIIAAVEAYQHANDLMRKKTENYK